MSAAVTGLDPRATTPVSDLSETGVFVHTDDPLPVGSEIELRPPGDLDLGDTVTFGEVQLAAADLGSVALGFYVAQERASTWQVHLNPVRDEPWTLSSKDRIVVLSGLDDPARPD